MYDMYPEEWPEQRSRREQAAAQPRRRERRVHPVTPQVPTRADS